MSTERTLTCGITANQIKAALLFVQDGEMTRAYLNGALIEHSPIGTRMVATDGQKLLVQRIDDEVTEDTVRYVVSRAVLETAVAAYGKIKYHAIAFQWAQETTEDPVRKGVTIVRCAHILVGDLHAVDVQDQMGKYPEWRRVMPSKISGELAQYDVDLLLTCRKARKLLAHDAPQYVYPAHNGSGPALVGISDDAIAIVMPILCKAVECAPDWISNRPAQKEAAAA